MFNGTQVSFVYMWKPILLLDQEKDNLILTCSYNNIINIFDFDKAKNTKEPTYQYNKHTMNSKLSWSNHDPNIFVSGSLDKNIFLWDIRIPNKQPVH